MIIFSFLPPDVHPVPGPDLSFLCASGACIWCQVQISRHIDAEGRTQYLVLVFFSPPCCSPAGHTEENYGADGGKESAFPFPHLGENAIGVILLICFGDTSTP